MFFSLSDSPRTQGLVCMLSVELKSNTTTSLYIKNSGIERYHRSKTWLIVPTSMAWCQWERFWFKMKKNVFKSSNEIKVRAKERTDKGSMVKWVELLQLSCV